MFKIIDPESGQRATIVSYFNEEQALRDISEWKKRQERGKRPDISRELLERLTVVPTSA